MTNSFEIALADEQRSMLNDEASLALLFNQLFQPSTNNYFKLAYELQREFRAGGSPQVTRISFDRLSFDSAAGVGKVRVLLDINFTFGCEDVNTEKKDQTSEWTFNANSKPGVLTFQPSAFAGERSTAEEF